MTCTMAEDYTTPAAGKGTDSNDLNTKTGDLTVVVSDRETHINEDMMGIDFEIECTLDAETELGTNTAQAAPYEKTKLKVKWTVYVRDDCDRISVTPIQMDYHIAIDPYRDAWTSIP